MRNFLAGRVGGPVETEVSESDSLSFKKGLLRLEASLEADAE